MEAGKRVRQGRKSKDATIREKAEGGEHRWTDTGRRDGERAKEGKGLTGREACCEIPDSISKLYTSGATLARLKCSLERLCTHMTGGTRWCTLVQDCTLSFPRVSACQT